MRERGVKSLRQLLVDHRGLAPIDAGGDPQARFDPAGRWQERQAPYDPHERDDAATPHDRPGESVRQLAGSHTSAIS
jgi:hypothetical protein